MSRARYSKVDIIAVARRHGSGCAADWAGVSGERVRQIRRADDPEYAPSKGVTLERLAAWADSDDCLCPRCATPARRSVIAARVTGMLGEGYGVATVARLLDVDEAFVRAQMPRRRRPSEWVRVR